MGLGAYEVHFKPRPHLLDLFIPGRSLVFYRGVERWSTGVITEPAKIEGNEIVVSGPGAEWWAGEDEKNGPIRTPRDYTGLRTDEIVDNLLFREDGTRCLNPGTLNAGNVIALFSIGYEPSRRAIRRLAAMTRTEYRVNPDFTFDWAGNLAFPGLFQDRNTIVYSETAKTAAEVRYESTSFRAAGKVIVLGKGEGDTLIVRSAIVALPAAWKDFNNQPFERDFLVDAPNANSTDEADFVAQVQAGLRGKLSKSATVTLSSSRRLADVDPGDTIYVHKQHVLEDVANSIAWRGRNYPAVAMRVASITVDLGKGWKVKWRDADGTETDITRYVNDLDKSTRVELGCTSDPQAFFDDISTGFDDRVDPPPPDDNADKIAPAPPAGLTVATASYKDSEGKTRARLKFDWTAVTVNSDATPCTDLAEYTLRYRKTTAISTDPWESRSRELQGRGWWGRWFLRNAGNYSTIDLTAHPDVDTIHDSVDLTNYNPTGQTGYYNAHLEGSFIAPVDGSFTFYFLHKHGLRVWLDGVQKINQWGVFATPPEEHTFVQTLVKGQRYAVIVEHHHETGTERLKIEWKGPNMARRLMTGPEHLEVSAPSNSATIEDLPPGLQWEAQVASRDTSANQSPWAPAVPITTLSGVDTTPPPRPAPPTAVGGIRQVHVHWDRLDSTGAAMPGDVRWYEVHASASSGFTPGPSTLKGEVQSTLHSFDAASGATLYIKLIAVDFANNKSTASAQAGPIAVGSVQTVDIAPLAISGALIADDAIALRHLGTGVVSADSMVVGDFSNLAVDPSFEKEADGAMPVTSTPNGRNWYTNYPGSVPWTIVTDVGNARTGSKCAKRIGTGSQVNDHYLVNGNRFSCRAGDQFYAECFYKSSSAPNGVVHMNIRWLDGAGGQLSSTDVAVSSGTPTVYTLLQGRATAPAGTVQAEPRVYVNGHTNTGIWYVDDVFVHRTTIAAYFSDFAAITALIADLTAGTGRIDHLLVQDGQIDTLAVNTINVKEGAITNLKIDTMVVTKLTGGNLEATVDITSGILRTASSGARTELNSSGVDIYMPQGSESIAQRIDWWRAGQSDANPIYRIFGYWPNTEFSGQPANTAIGRHIVRDVANSGNTLLQHELQANDGTRLALIEFQRDTASGYRSYEVTFSNVTDSGIKLFNSPVSAQGYMITRLQAPLSIKGEGITVYNADALGPVTAAATNKGTCNPTWSPAWNSNNAIPNVLGTVQDGSTSRMYVSIESKTRSGCTANVVNESAASATGYALAMPLGIS